MSAAACVAMLWGAVTPEREETVVRRSSNAQSQRATRAMERYAAGDDSAFEELYRLLSPRLYRLCAALAGRNDADELLQEVFLKLHRARGSFAPGGSVVAWSYAIARTTQLDRMRRRARRPESPLEAEQLDSCGAQDAENPESLSSERDLALMLETELQRLSETQRSAYVLVKLEGMRCADAAEVLGVSINAVKQRVHRASEQLKSALVAAGWSFDAAAL
jgi:RNA polymerase sigma-70 factor (ECF subfamily)